MSRPRVVAVTPDSPADGAGIQVGDVLVAVNDEHPRDVIHYQMLTDEAELSITIERGGLERTFELQKREGDPVGLEVDSAVFDGVTTCDNHCSFCFIYQLPKGMRQSLYLKDDDYRLSFLYGNFTTLTRFTEADLERIVTEQLSPIYVSIHTTDRELRAHMLRNRRGAISLRWLRALLDHGIEVHGQVVVCPGVNDGEALEMTMVDILADYPELQSVAVVPLGVSRYSSESEMRPHTMAEAEAVVDLVEEWQAIFLDVLGRRITYAADEYYLLTGREFPPAEAYDGFAMYEDGIGMARSFEQEFWGHVADDEVIGPTAGFFAAVDGAPAEGYRAPRTDPQTTAHPRPVALNSASHGVAVLTGEFGAQVIGPMVAELAQNESLNARVVTVKNQFFGGNIGVTGLITGADVSRVLATQPHGDRYLLPDVCLSGGRFIDGMMVGELPQPVEVVPTNGRALRKALEQPAPPEPAAPRPVPVAVPRRRTTND